MGFGSCVNQWSFGVGADNSVVSQRSNRQSQLQHAILEEIPDPRSAALKVMFYEWSGSKDDPIISEIMAHTQT